jgi:MoaA/NifB/PqqE/SkfB family radical SAM enzyme
MIIDLTGEVVPCCFWAGYGNSGKPLGNTNVNSLDEIWHGKNYRSLRAKMASGDLKGHPCGSCMAYRWGNDTFPKFSWPAGFVHETGYCYLGQIPEEFTKATASLGQPIRLYEDGNELPLPDARHDEIRQLGAGRYSIWHGWLYFSSSDNSNALNSGRRYRLVCGEHATELGGLVAESQSGRNLRMAYQEYREGRVRIESEPSMISFISTADCNIDCPACSQNIVRVTKVQHRPETVPGVLSKVPYLSQFIWHGGEPYLIKAFRHFIDVFKVDDNPNLAFGFTSNGTMITEDEGEKLKKFPRINASVSIDSFNPDTFRRIRAGASFDRVWQNVERLMALHNAPTRVVSVGMIICKSNFRELADNLRFAIDHDIGLNLSPVVIYPVVEQLDCFSDFEVETTGWEEILREAAAVVQRAKADRRVALGRVDPSGMIAELRRIFDEARKTYSDVVPLVCEIRDPHHSIQYMRRPAVIAYDATDQPRAYVKVRPGLETCVLKVPRRYIADQAAVRIALVHDAMEPFGALANTTVPVEEFAIRIYIPRFSAAERPRNIHWANYGVSTPDGNHIREPAEINRYYQRLHEHEVLSDDSDLQNVRADERPTASPHIRLVGNGVGWSQLMHERVYYTLMRGLRALRKRIRRLIY